MHLWAEEEPRAGRRLAAANYVTGNSGSPLPGGRDWAAKSLESVVPSPPFRSIFRGALVLIPTIAEAEKLRKAHNT